MCRGSAGGGRRCPSHSDEAKARARNARRREVYQDKKKSALAATTLADAGIPVVSGADFGPTYFQERDGLGFDPDKFAPVKNRVVDQELLDSMKEMLGDGDITASLSQWAKPESGGLWTAPATSTEKGLKTSWTDWSHWADFRTVRDSFVEVKPKDHAVLVRCDSLEDLDRICQRWPGYPLDFEAMAEAGVHGLSLSQNAVDEAKGARHGAVSKGFSYWDVDSTVWFNPLGFEAKKKVAAAVYEPKPREDEDDGDMDFYVYEDDGAAIPEDAALS